MNATRKAAEEILDDESGMKTIRTLRKAAGDLPELETDELAQDVLAMIKNSWLIEGRENLLRTVPSMWQEVYDQLLGVDLAEPGKDPEEWYTNELVT
jgi:hypothetical protein